MLDTMIHRGYGHKPQVDGDDPINTRVCHEETGHSEEPCLRDRLPLAYQPRNSLGLVTVEASILIIMLDEEKIALTRLLSHQHIIHHIWEAWISCKATIVILHEPISILVKVNRTLLRLNVVSLVSWNQAWKGKREHGI
jgi:hypothetical protein